MFGYIRPVRAELLVKEADFYEAVYCGLCMESGKKITRFSRLLLNYDFTFLALLRLSLSDGKATVVQQRCPYRLKKKPAVVCDGVFDFVCSAFGLFAYYKWKDDLQDEKGFSRFGKKLLSPFFSRIRKKALSLGLPEELIREPIERLHSLEAERCASPDKVADCFGALMRDVAAFGLTGDKALIAGQCGYHIGRFVYLIDAYDDLESDEKSGSYNPFLLCYGSKAEALSHKDEIRTMW